MHAVPIVKQVATGLWLMACVSSATFVGELGRGRPGAHQGDRGATAAEYALMVSLIAVVIIAAVAAFGRSMIPLFEVPSSALLGH